MAQPCYDGFVLSFRITMCLRVIHCCCQMFETEKGAECLIEFTDEPQIIVDKQQSGNPVRYDPVVEEY